jgi:peroxin-19
MPGKDDLNDILDAALDELDDDSDDSCVDTTSQENSKTQSQTRDQDESAPKPMFGPPRPPNISEEEKAVMDMMRQMENLFPSEDFGKEGNTHVNLTPAKKDKSQDTPNNKQNGDSKGGEMNDTVSQLLKELSKTEDFDESAFQNFGDEMADEMEKEWEETMKKAGGGSSANEDEDAMGNVVDGMMKQFLSKEFMYEPMKDITERFPKWLAENKEKLSPEEYEK